MLFIYCSCTVQSLIANSIITITPGVGIGIVDLGYERRLASHLGAHRAPSIIGLLNGRVTFFHQAVVREYLRQFIEDLLPTKLVEKVNVTDRNTLPLLLWECITIFFKHKLPVAMDHMNDISSGGNDKKNRLIITSIET